MAFWGRASTESVPTLTQPAPFPESLELRRRMVSTVGTQRAPVVQASLPQPPLKSGGEGVFHRMPVVFMCAWLPQPCAEDASGASFEPRGAVL